MSEPQKVARKLSAILSADVKGYSRLMSDDESHTIKTLKDYRKIMSEIITSHSGRVVDAPGDNLLAEFSSAVNAAECSVEIQKILKAKNDELPDDKKLIFRIGVNIGDVVQDGDSLYGEGVNIAARIEGLAEPGGVCISRNTYDQIKNKLKLGYEYIGEHAVKNIKDPVRVYKLLMEPGDAGKLIGDEPKPLLKPGTWATVIMAAIVLILIGYQLFQKLTLPEFEPASAENMTLQLPEKPSIAVLPFKNISNDSNLDDFCDGFAEEIPYALSKIPDLFVIARDSVSTYKDKKLKFNQIAEELGIRYILEGSARKADDKLRITAQLVDTLSGKYLWVERYDRNLEDIFALQDEITMSVITALQVKLTEGEKIHSLTKNTTNLSAYLKWVEGRKLFLRLNKDDCFKARQLLEEAIALDPEFPAPYADLAWTHVFGIRFGLSKSPKEALKIATDLAEKAINLDESLPFGHCVLSAILTAKRQYEKAIAQGEKAVSLSPGNSLAIAHFARALGYAGRYEESIAWLEKAIRLDPKALNWYLNMLGHCYIFIGRYEEAIEQFKKVLDHNPKDEPTRVRLAAAYILSGQDKDAKTQAAEILKQNPEFGVASIKKWPINKTNDRDLLINALVKAGLPENPPLPLPDKPSIGVLPFDNMSGDKEQEYFSDGITEDIITALSKTPKMFVIARKSTFAYKGKSVKVQEIGRDLGARYVLEGSVRKVGSKVRINAQLSDARTGHHLWAEKYDRDLKDVFILQDEITKNIITALQVKLTEGEQARIRSKGTDNLDAYLLVIEARELLRNFNIEDNLKAKELLTKAIVLDPNYAPAYRWLSSTHYMDTWIGATKSPKESLQKAVELSQKALSIDGSLGDAHALLGCIYIKLKEYDKSLPEFEKALELYPGGSDTIAMVANQYLYLDKTDEAILLMKKAIEPFPIPPGWALNALAAMYRSKGDYEEALRWSEKAVKEQPRSFISHLNLCSIYSLMGKQKEARLQAEEVLKLKPEFSVKRFEKGLPYINPEVKKTYMDAVRKAGLPE